MSEQIIPWPEYRSIMCNPKRGDVNPDLVQDAWIWLVSSALKRKEDIPKNILESHSEIEFKGTEPYWKNDIPWRNIKED